MDNPLYSIPYPELVRLFAKRVEEQYNLLKSIDDKTASKPPAPGKWCIKEIAGHMVDSAGNNHQRFVRACTQGNLVFLPYDQDKWVSLQKYYAYPWIRLVELWRLYNLHIVHIMEAIPENIRLNKTKEHNFHRIAFNGVIEGDPSSLDYFIRDYVVHFEHHCRQIRQVWQGVK